MNKIKLACLASFLSTSFAYAATPCDGFELKIKNNLADNLLVTTLKLNGAELQPGGIQKIDSKTAQVFTINSSANDVPMVGEFVFHTISLPIKKVTIQFTLNNSSYFCEHTDTSTSSDYSIEKTRLPGSVNYVIGY
ncbi:hypothetical protein TUM19329_29430 [Legionella antarctica]|uniref:VirK protein n=1 Tax=Legionella antarctica TaxID=2708020 RepID=A0A6F8T953_9GAMM|nr:hypothetical protein [Legionella antarctica]BCA96582.1 hypothetical protein TUM19329_29430 [Legionella antarctica]